MFISKVSMMYIKDISKLRIICLTWYAYSQAFSRSNKDIKIKSTDKDAIGPGTKSNPVANLDSC